MSNQEHTDGLTRRTLIKSTALGSLALAAGGLSLPFSLSHAAAAVQKPLTARAYRLGRLFGQLRQPLRPAFTRA